MNEFNYEGWIGSIINSYSSESEFPEHGSSKALYIVVSNGNAAAYVWDEENLKYIKIGGGSVEPDPVGGRIFYINSNSTEVVEFYDAQGNVIQNVAVGDSPAKYKVTDKGNGKKKYYILDTTYTPIYTDTFYWTYKKDGNWVYEDTGAVDNLGSGKTNTLNIMAIRDGEYITEHADPESVSPTPTIWWFINYMNTNKIGGCSDWCIGSFQDYIKLKDFLVAESLESTYHLDDGLFTSVDYDVDITHAYVIKTATGTFEYPKNSSSVKGCAIRYF